jgi:hypothetical protein
VQYQFQIFILVYEYGKSKLLMKSAFAFKLLHRKLEASDKDDLYRQGLLYERQKMMFGTNVDEFKALIHCLPSGIHGI